jgi:hypothetical protein
VALPRKRQRLALFLKSRDIPQHIAADAVKISRVRFGNILKGITYPSPGELDRIETLMDGLPATLYFDPAMLAWRYDWPPRVRGGE